MNIEKILIDLLLDRPFFGTILASLEIVEDAKNTPTACTDGRVININPEFYESLTYYQQLSLLAHEVLHVGLCHHVRIRGRDLLIWNIAADMAINPLLKESGFELPPGAICDSHCPTRSAEDIYDEIFKNGKAYSSNSWGDVCLLPNGKGRILVEEEIYIGSLLNRAKSIAGDLPMELNRAYHQIVDIPPLPWSYILIDFVHRIVGGDELSRKFKSRYIQSGYYFQEFQNEELQIIIIIDTSGSISESDLSTFILAIEDIRSIYPTTITLLYCDTKVYEGGIILPEDKMPTTVIGGGGTDFRSPFHWLSIHLEIDPNCVIYFTDGECNSYPNLQLFPILWVIKQDNNISIKTDGFWRTNSKIDK
jgi:predicted metal-dependent peptidase